MLAAPAAIDAGTSEGPNMTRRSASFVAMAIVAVALAACGGGGRLTKSELIAQGDAICRTFAQKAGPIGNDITAAPSADNLSQYAAAFGQLEAVFSDMIDGLKALSPPEGDQATWDSITSRLTDELGALREATAAAESGDLNAFNAAGAKIGELDNQTSQFATTYGFQVCGGRGSGSSGATGAAGASGGSAASGATGSSTATGATGTSG
jgi:hypothetical protein